MKISHNLSKPVQFLEGSLMPQAKFLTEIYQFALARYNWAGQFVQSKIVLDAGCGSGYGAKKLLDLGAEKVYGVDLSPDSIEFCRKKYKDKNLFFSRQDLSRLNFPNNFFDLIVAFEVIEHIENYKQAINEFYRILKPTGRLIISTPNKAIYSPDTSKPFYPFHFHEFYLEDFKEMLSVFKIKTIKGQYVKGKKFLNYGPWNPKRILRIIYANLPFTVKRAVTRIYLKTYNWICLKKIYQPKRIKLSDIYFSDNLTKTRIFVAACQKPQRIKG